MHYYYTTYLYNYDLTHYVQNYEDSSNMTATTLC